ncbi:GntR family transcriptional regulator [Homoserinimonas sp. OAct 916]|uniref:GntR family transcriptional regulator n=1 Tax=Homoserinimonas sp. OAct 916 TaxID=2211450 RepID=UPI0018E518FC|nr:GntR family transcriptional regulator [Homoserinimonas sp. OAct 916]
MTMFASDVDDDRPVELAYRSIRDQILSGEQAGGEWLRESDLAAEIGVSRTPVREALRRLEADGLVRHERNRGAQVQSWAFKDLENVYAIRSRLEPWGSALAATSGEADLGALEGLAAEMDRVAAAEELDVDLLTKLNAQFHDAILIASGNVRLRSLLTTLVQVPFVWRTFSHYTPDELRRSLAHHHELIDALRAQDATWAESVMRAHIHSAWVSVTREAAEDETT